MANPYYIPRPNRTAAMISALLRVLDDYKKAQREKDIEKRQADEAAALKQFRDAQLAIQQGEADRENTRFEQTQQERLGTQYQEDVMRRLGGGLSFAERAMMAASGQTPPPIATGAPLGPIVDAGNVKSLYEPPSGLPPEQAQRYFTRAVAGAQVSEAGTQEAVRAYKTEREKEQQAAHSAMQEEQQRTQNLAYGETGEARAVSVEQRAVEAAAGVAAERKAAAEQKIADKGARQKIVAGLSDAVQAAYGTDTGGWASAQLGLQDYVDTGTRPNLTFLSGLDKFKNAIVAQVDTGQLTPQEALVAAKEMAGITVQKTKSDEVDQYIAALTEHKGLYPPAEFKKRQANMVAILLNADYTAPQDAMAEMDRYGEELLAGGMDPAIVDRALQTGKAIKLSGDATAGRQLMDSVRLADLYTQLRQTADPNEKAGIQAQIIDMVPGIPGALIGAPTATTASRQQVNDAWNQLAARTYQQLGGALNAIPGTAGAGRFNLWMLPKLMGQETVDPETKKADGTRRTKGDFFVQQAAEIARNTLGDTPTGRDFLRGVWAMTNMDEKTFAQAVKRYGYTTFSFAGESTPNAATPSLLAPGQSAPAPTGTPTSAAPAAQGAGGQARMPTAAELGMAMTQIRAATTLDELRAALEAFPDGAPDTENAKATAVAEQVHKRIMQTGGQAPLGNPPMGLPSTAVQTGAQMASGIGAPTAQVPSLTAQQIADLKLIGPGLRRRALEKLYGPGHEVDIERTLRQYQWVG